MAESEEKLNSFLTKVKKNIEKDGLKLNIKKTEITASDLITSWQIEGGKVEAMTNVIFLGSIITTNVTAVMKLKDTLLLGRKAMTNLDRN